MPGVLGSPVNTAPAAAWAPARRISRAVQLRRPAAVPLENAGEPADPHTPQEELERRELHRAVQQALDRLTPEHREVLLLRQMQGLSYQEIGAALSLEEGTVKSRLSRAKRQLRTILAEGNLLGEPDVIQDRRGAGE